MDARIGDTGTYQHERKIQMNDRNQKSLVQILERDNFRKRISENKIYEYEVVQYSFDEVDRNYKRPYRQAQRRHRKNYPFKLSDYM